MIILIGGEKGGTGKSTLTINLAVCRAIDNKEVLIVDADKQGTTNLWSSLRNEKTINPQITCIQKQGKQLHKDIISLSDKYETIIIDAGGRDSVELRSAMLVADKFVTPIRASQSDAWTLDNLEQLITQALVINEDLKTFIVINQGPTNPAISEIEEIKGLLEEFKSFLLVKSIIRDRISFRHALKEGLGVIELKPFDKKAINEITELYKEIFK
ncbi:AAA family ATPase [Patescibacteria group bacterium]|nr:AAA family ATPase [Patescibacteria group bacterium]